MPILGKQALGHVRLELGKNLPSEVDPLYVLNAAGRHLAAMRAWSWLNRSRKVLGVQAGVSYVVLPGDYAHPRLLLASDSLLSSARVVSEEELAFREATQESPGDNIIRWCSFTWDGGEGPPQARINLYPTPQTTTTSSLVLIYRAGWREVKGDNETLPLHPSAELLYIDILRTIVQGFMKSHEATLSQRLNVVEKGATFMNAAADDINSDAETPMFDASRYTVLWPVPKITNQP